MEDVKICKTIKIRSKLSGFICAILRRIISMDAILQVNNQLEDDAIIQFWSHSKALGNLDTIKICEEIKQRMKERKEGGRIQA